MIKLITHCDLDGIGCIILAKLFFKDNIDYTICKSLQDVNEVLNNININQYEQIFITDIICNEEYLHNSKIQLFDHHQTAEYLNQYSNCIVRIEINNKKTCGTELFYHYLLKIPRKIQEFFVKFR